MILHKFKRFIHTFICFPLITLVLILSGCTDENFSIYFGINSMPVNIDPQLASSYSELLTVRNCFRGLMKLDTDDTAVYDIAESCDISSDGLEYTFKLKQSEWSNGAAVTADDFVFAMLRATDPVTSAPYSNLLLNICGASERLNGTGGELSVYAKDDNTLVINLVKPDNNFLSSLVNAVFMPCNKEFFEKCGGKYGLGKNYILTNGNFKVSLWSNENYIKLSRTSGADNKYSQADSIILTVSSTGKDNISRIKDKEIGMTADSINDYGSLNTENYTVDIDYKKTYAIVFNKASQLGSNTKLTAAFAKSVHREFYASQLNNRFLSADSVIPTDSILFNKRISDLTELPQYTYSFISEESRAEFLEAVSELNGKKLPEINVLTVDNDEIKSVLTNIVSKWQSNLGAYVNITTVASEKSLLRQISGGNYTVAFVPFSDNVISILNNFTLQSGSGMSINNTDYDETVELLNNTDDLRTALDAVKAAANILSKESAVIPIFSVPTAYIWNSSYNNVYFSSIDGTVDFSIIYK